MEIAAEGNLKSVLHNDEHIKTLANALNDQNLNQVRATIAFLLINNALDISKSQKKILEGLVCGLDDFEKAKVVLKNNISLQSHEALSNLTKKGYISKIFYEESSSEKYVILNFLLKK